ncbi:hypothetical protein Tco_0025870 [Tanacetum coccineum]
MIGSSNMRIDPSNMQKEATYQVILDILKLSPCYNAFLITANVFEIYWFTVTKIKVPNKEFIKPHPYDSWVTFLKQLGYKGSLDLISDMLKFISKGELTQVYGMYIPNEMMNDEIKNSVAYQTYLALSTGIKPPKKGIGQSMSLTEAKIAVKNDDLHETHASLVIGREETSKVDKDVIPKGSSEGSGSKPEVSDEPKGKSICSSEGAEEVILSSDDERTESEKEAVESKKADKQTANKKEVHSDEEMHIEEEEEQTVDEQYNEQVHDDEEMHDDDKKHDDGKVVDDEKEDEEMVDAEKVNAKKLEEVKVENEQARDGQADKDDHAKVDTGEDDKAGALISVTQNEKLELPLSTSSLSLSSDYCNQFLNLSSDVSLVSSVKETADTDINSLLDV